MSEFRTEIYITWRYNRMQAILAYYGAEYFANKKMADLGAGDGSFGQMFAELGAHVDCYEGRDANLYDIKQIHPNLTPVKWDFNYMSNEDLPHYDVILNVGLIYHLHDIEAHLRECLRRCDDLILETEVLDYNREAFLVFKEPGPAQLSSSLDSWVTVPSVPYIETILADSGASWDKPADLAALSANSCWHYNWPPNNDGWKHESSKRMMWFIRSNHGR